MHEPPIEGDDWIIQRMQAGIKARLLRPLTGAGHDLREISSKAILASFCAAAFSPLIGFGGEAGAGLGVLSTVGGGVLATIITNAIEHLREGGKLQELESAELEEQIARHFERVLEAGDANAEAVQAKMAAVLHEIDARAVLLQAAIDARDEQIRGDVIAAAEKLDVGFAELQKSMDERIARDRADSELLDQNVALVRMMRQDIAAIPSRIRAELAGVGDINGLRPIWTDGCPYQGLAPFGQAEAELFYGREHLTADLAGRVAEQVSRGGVVVVTGASGAGKSSLLRAGLLHVLDEGVQVRGSAHWPRIVMTPTADPLAELSTQLAARGGNDGEAIRERLMQYPGQAETVIRETLLADAARRPRPQMPMNDGTLRMVLVVDQFEQIFTLSPGSGGEPGRQAFITALCASANNPVDPDGRPAALVVIAVRGDFWDQCAAYPELAEEMKRGQFIVTPMTETDLRLAITGPAGAAGLRLDAGLADVIIADLRALGRDHAAGALPLLSQAMLLTWQNRQGDLLTSHGYGLTRGVARVVQTTADGVYDALSADQQMLAQRIFRSMAAVDLASRRLSSRPVRRDDLHDRGTDDRDQVDGVLRAFAEKRLIVLDRSHVEVAHEALIDEWPRLGEWVKADWNFQNWLNRTRAQAETWEINGRDRDALLRGKALEQASDWCAERPGEIDPDTKTYVIRSQLAKGSLLDMTPENTIDIVRDMEDRQLLADALDTVIRTYMAQGNLVLAATYWKERQASQQPQRRPRTTWLKFSNQLFKYGSQTLMLKMFGYYAAWLFAWLLAVSFALAPLVPPTYPAIAVVVVIAAASILVWYGAGPLVQRARSIRGENCTPEEVRWRVYHGAWRTVRSLPFALALAEYSVLLLFFPGFRQKMFPKHGGLVVILAAATLGVEFLVLLARARINRLSPLLGRDEPYDLDEVE